MGEWFPHFIAQQPNVMINIKVSITNRKTVNVRVVLSHFLLFFFFIIIYFVGVSVYLFLVYYFHKVYIHFANKMNLMLLWRVGSM